MATQVIVVADDATVADVTRVAPGIITALEQNMFLMSNDNVRMYVRATTWANMQASQKLAR